MVLNNLLDITLLRQNATEAEIEVLCEDALKHGVAGVCVNPCFVKQVSRALSGSEVKTVAVVGFPLGANATELKIAEAMFAMECGASEVDMVINYNLFKTRPEKMAQEIAQVKTTVVLNVKAIIETSLLSPCEIELASELAIKAGADYIKTNTGFGSRGVTIEDVEIIKRVIDRLGKRTEIKASGGIHSKEFAEALVHNGVTRIGTSNYHKLLG